MADWAKFARLCGLLASDFDGERANAATFATKWLKENKLTWQDVADLASRDAPQAPQWDFTIRPKRPPPRPPIDPMHWGNIDHMLKAHDGKFSGWEREFLTSIRQRATELTEKQQSVLDRLKQKYP